MRTLVLPFLLVLCVAAIGCSATRHAASKAPAVQVDVHAALIRAENADHVAIIGPGAIMGPVPLGNLRNPRGPCIMEFIECSDVRLEAFSVKYERMWAIHPTYCRDVNIKGLTIRSSK